MSDTGQLHHNGALRVFVLASVRLYREGLADRLCAAGMEVTGQAAAWPDALAAIVDEPPDVAVLDVAGPGGLEIVSELRRRAPDVHIVVLAIDEVGRGVVAWAEAGISGYVTRDGTVADLIRAVQSAARHEMHCSPHVSAALLEHVHVLAERGSIDSPMASLTSREHEIAELLEAGFSNKQIAAELQIELATVKNHVHSILGKLQVSRRIDAATHMRRARRAMA